MKHLKKGRKFGRVKKQREAMLKILLGELLKRGKIVTTEAKAKETGMHAEKTLSGIKRIFKEGGQKADQSRIRILRQGLPADVDVKRLVEIHESIKAKQSGFTRVTKINKKRSDGAKMAAIEIIKQ